MSLVKVCINDTTRSSISNVPLDLEFLFSPIESNAHAPPLHRLIPKTSGKSIVIVEVLPPRKKVHAILQTDTFSTENELRWGEGKKRSRQRVKHVLGLTLSLSLFHISSSSSFFFVLFVFSLARTPARVTELFSPAVTLHSVQISGVPDRTVETPAGDKNYHR